MNGSKAADMGQVPPKGEGGALLKWAEVRKSLREARKGVLNTHGLNEDSLKRLEEEAFLEFCEVNQDEIQTEHGIVYFAYHPMFIHKNSEVYGGTKRLHWREK